MRNIKQKIAEKLTTIEEAEHVKILYAAESGSRAWGVESADSDYDVRFIYVRPEHDYLSLQEKRDVIEWQLDEILDINGWDLKKALIQFHKGNATLFEWANSPIIYRTTEEWDELYPYCQSYFSVKAALYHYYGTAASAWKQFLQGNEVNYKKYIYALRPLLACNYIEKHRTIPPVTFHELLNQSLPEQLTEEIRSMLSIKAKSRESDLHPKLPVIHTYIEDKIAVYGQLSKSIEDDRTPDWDILQAAFLKLVKRS